MSRPPWKCENAGLASNHALAAVTISPGAAASGALSADHIEYASESGIAAMGKAGTVAVLLPGAYYFLRETQKPPVDKLRAAKVPMAVSTDLNPGTSPFASIRLAMNQACVQFGLTRDLDSDINLRQDIRAIYEDDGYAPARSTP